MTEASYQRINVPVHGSCGGARRGGSFAVRPPSPPASSRSQEPALTEASYQRINVPVHGGEDSETPGKRGTSRARSQMARVGRAGVLQLPRGAGQQRRASSVPQAGDPGLVLGASAPEPDRPGPHLDADVVVRGPLTPRSPDPAPVPERALLRQAPAARAGCGNSARPDPCGGRAVRPGPTATLRLQLPPMGAAGAQRAYASAPIGVILTRDTALRKSRASPGSRPEARICPGESGANMSRDLESGSVVGVPRCRNPA